MRTSLKTSLLMAGPSGLSFKNVKRQIFRHGDLGAWLDPSDLSTLCQTYNGTSGNVAVGDPVGRIDDKSGNGNDAIQSTAGSRPILSRHPKGGIRNKLRNNMMVGAVAGTPGTLPTNWSFAVQTTTGLATSVVGTGTENGVTYIDLRLAGTASGAGIFQVRFETTSGVDALTAQEWTLSSYVKLSAGTLTGLSSPIFSFAEYTSVPGYIKQTTAAAATPTSADLDTQRTSAGVTLSGGGTTAHVQPIYQMSIANGASVDCTLRIGLPQIELSDAVTAVQEVSSIYDITELGVADVYGYYPDNSNDYYTCDMSSVDWSGGWEAILAVYYDSAPVTDTAFTLSNAVSSATDWAGIAFDSSSRPIVTTNGKTSSTGAALTAGAHVLRLQWNGTQFKLWVDGALEITETPGSSITWSAIDYLALSATLDSTPEYSAGINEGFMVIDRTLTDSQAQQAEQYFYSVSGASPA